MIYIEMKGIASYFRVRVIPLLAYLSYLLVVYVLRSSMVSSTEENPALVDSIPEQKH